jgi:hypothetical protein
VIINASKNGPISRTDLITQYNNNRTHPISLDRLARSLSIIREILTDSLYCVEISEVNDESNEEPAYRFAKKPPITSSQVP